MLEANFFGLPLEGINSDKQVIAAVVVIKSFDEESETSVAYSMGATDGLTSVEALGMMEYANMMLRKQLSQTI
jgi:hypothetical protein